MDHSGLSIPNFPPGDWFNHTFTSEEDILGFIRREITGI
jgi:hypothetical protein